MKEGGEGGRERREDGEGGRRGREEEEGGRKRRKELSKEDRRRYIQGGCEVGGQMVIVHVGDKNDLLVPSLPSLSFSPPSLPPSLTSFTGQSLVST